MFDERSLTNGANIIVRDQYYKLLLSPHSFVAEIAADTTKVGIEWQAEFTLPQPMTFRLHLGLKRQGDGTNNPYVQPVIVYDPLNVPMLVAKNELSARLLCCLALARQLPRNDHGTVIAGGYEGRKVDALQRVLDEEKLWTAAANIPLYRFGAPTDLLDYEIIRLLLGETEYFTDFGKTDLSEAIDKTLNEGRLPKDHDSALFFATLGLSPIHAIFYREYYSEAIWDKVRREQPAFIDFLPDLRAELAAAALVDILCDPANR